METVELTDTVSTDVRMAIHVQHNLELYVQPARLKTPPLSPICTIPDGKSSWTDAIYPAQASTSFHQVLPSP